MKSVSSSSFLLAALASLERLGIHHSLVWRREQAVLDGSTAARSKGHLARRAPSICTHRRHINRVHQSRRALCSNNKERKRNFHHCSSIIRDGYLCVNAHGAKPFAAAAYEGLNPEEEEDRQIWA